MRLISLIRHGQYRSSDGGGTLTAVGRRQARAVGKRLAEEGFDALYCSTLGRAIETADLVAERCGVACRPPLAYLRESLPTAVPGYRVPLAVRAEGKARIETIARKHLRPSRRDRHEVLICHGNLIRGVVSHALGVRPTTWRRMFIHHASLTQIVVTKGGRTALLCYNDTGHLSPALTTMASVAELRREKA